MDDDGGEEDGQVQVKLVADKLVWGRQLIQVITFPPSRIGPRHLWSTAALSAVQLEMLEKQGHCLGLVRLLCGTSRLMISASDQHWVVTHLLLELGETIVAISQYTEQYNCLIIIWILKS